MNPIKRLFTWLRPVLAIDNSPFVALKPGETVLLVLKAQLTPAQRELLRESFASLNLAGKRRVVVMDGVDHVEIVKRSKPESTETPAPQQPTGSIALPTDMYFTPLSADDLENLESRTFAKHETVGVFKFEPGAEAGQPSVPETGTAAMPQKASVETLARDIAELREQIEARARTEVEIQSAMQTALRTADSSDARRIDHSVSQPIDSDEGAGTDGHDSTSDRIERYAAAVAAGSITRRVAWATKSPSSAAMCTGAAEEPARTTSAIVPEPPCVIPRWKAILSALAQRLLRVCRH